MIAETQVTFSDNVLTQLQNRSFHVVERTRTSSKCQKMKNARAKRAKILFFIVKYANLWGFCCRRRRGCLNSLLTAWTTSMLNCWPTKNLLAINRSWDDFSDRKFDSNSIHAAENAAFLFFLSGSREHSLTSVENLRQNPAMRS